MSNQIPPYLGAPGRHRPGAGLRREGEQVKQLSYRVTEDFLERIKAQAERFGIPDSHYVHWAVVRLTEEHEAEEEAADSHAGFSAGDGAS